MDLLFFILISYGLTSIIIWGSIFDKIRPEGKPWNCMHCMGFWTGILLAVLDPYNYLYNIVVNYNTITILLLGFLSSGTNYILGSLFDDKGLKIEYNNSNN